MMSASSRGATIRSADLPSSSSFRIGLYQKKSRERRRTILGSVTIGMSPRSATRFASARGDNSFTTLESLEDADVFVIECNARAAADQLGKSLVRGHHGQRVEFVGAGIFDHMHRSGMQ